MQPVAANFSNDGGWFEGIQLRRVLISIRGANPSMSDEFKAHMTGATQQLADCESVVEEFLASGGNKPNPARLNAIVSVQVDKLSEILEALKQDIGG